MGAVYLVRDTLQVDRPVALKILRPEAIDPVSVDRFKNEFRSMSHLRHPNLAEVYDFGTVTGDGRHFLTMEYVEGRELTSLRWPAVAPSFDGLVVQCLRGLDYIHARGLLHNDIKPHNILIREPFQAKILDFGLAQPLAGPSSAGTSGTLHYVAPERLRGHRPDARSDLYSLGVVLYEILTGRLPYQGEEAGAVVSAILEGRLVPPRELNPDLPRRTEAFVLGLLARDPDDRPASAAAALDLLNAGASAPQELDTDETLASFVTSGRFVGRDRELTALADLAKAHVREPGDETRPRFVLLAGASGIGKSRLLRELKHRLQLAGIRNLTGRCYEDGGAPFQPFVEVLRQLPTADEAGLPAGLRPVLGRVLSGGGSEDGRRDAGGGGQPTRLDREQFIDGLSACLDLLAGGTPGVIVLEDLHWANAPEIELLERLVLKPAGGPWLIVASARDEEARTAPIGEFLKRFTGLGRIRRFDLRPLDLGESTALLASMVPFEEQPERLARLLLDHTEGNPLYIEELMKALAEEGTLRRSGGYWIAESRSLDTIRLPPSLASVIARRLGSLDPLARSVAEVLAVFNRPVSRPLLGRALGRDLPSVAGAIEALDRLRVASVEAQRSGPELAGLSHARIREAIYSALPEERRRALHRAVGRAIEAEHAASLGEVVEELAHHFFMSGDREASVTYSLRAAEKAEMFNLSRHVEFLARALDCLPPGPSERRRTILFPLAQDMLVDLGEFEKGRRHAEDLLQESRQAGDSLHELRALRLLAWAASSSGDPREAGELGRRALAIARTKRESRETAVCLNVIAIISARQSEPRKALEALQEARGIYESLDDTSGMITTMNNIALCYLGLGEAVAARDLLQRMLDLARASGQTNAYYRFVSNLIIAVLETGDLPGAIVIGEEALAWSREHAGIDQAGHQLEQLGQMYAEQGRFDRAIRTLEEERALRKGTGDAAGQLPPLDYLGGAWRDLGRADLAERQHREGRDLARSLNLRMQEAYLLNSLAVDRLLLGGVGAAEEMAEEALSIGRELAHPRIIFHATSVLARVASLRRDRKAVLGVSRNLTRIDPRTLRYKDRLQMNLVLGRAALEVGKIADAEREARVGLQQAEKAGFRETQWRFQALLGDVLAVKGLPDDARHAYNAAYALIRGIADDIEDPAMRDEYEKSEPRQEVARKASDSAPPPLAAHTAAADARTAPLRMLTTLYEIARTINSILDLKELLNKVMDLAIDLVGAERGLIFMYRSETDEMEMVVGRNLEHQTIKDATEYSRSILREAGLGRSILSHDAGVDERFKSFKSVAMFSIRSLLCVPLRIRNRVLGTVYVDTRKPGVVFTDDDLRFLETFANQAAVAIENARLYEQVRQENQYLKAAVQERYGYENIIGRSEKMRDLYATLSRVAPSSLPVMIRGESGTGKELVARAAHQNSARREKRFFSENCAALTDTLLESELFGHVKGAFTGADAPRKGLFELADGGTLFLDEVGDMSLAMQSKLLRVLQDGEIRPVGSEASRRVDVRIISATNRDLETMVKEKAFREDLYFRLNVISVKLPALRDRRDDIPLLVDHFLTKVANENKTLRLRVDPGLMSNMMRYGWPGNVRELENQVYKLALFCAGDTLTLEEARHDPEFFAKISGLVARAADGALTRDDLERALAEAKGSRDEAARLLGISRATMFRRLKQLRINQPAPRPARRIQSEG